MKIEQEFKIIKLDVDQLNRGVDVPVFIDALRQRFEKNRNGRDDDELFGISWSTDISNE